MRTPETQARIDASTAPRSRASHRTPCLRRDRKSTRLNSSHSQISYAVFCLKKKKCLDYIPYFNKSFLLFSFLGFYFSTLAPSYTCSYLTNLSTVTQCSSRHSSRPPHCLIII